MKHTPGPWSYDGKFTVSIPHKDGLACFRTMPGDARLIAAAPDLFELVKDARGTCRNSGLYGPLGISPGGCSESVHSCVACRARKLIEMIEGEE